MFSDFRYATRALTRNPGFTAIAIVTLALGIGANTAIFSVVNGVLLRPLPYGDPDRLVQVWTSTTDESRSNHSAGDFLDLQRENQSLTAIAGYRAGAFSVARAEGAGVHVEGVYVTADFFDVLSVGAMHGRTFTRAADATAGERLVVLSHETARRLFGDEARAVGERVRLNGEPHAVTGVLPSRAGWPESTRIWILSDKPVPPSPVDSAEPLTEREIRYFEAIGRLKPGITFEQAQQDLHRVASVIQQHHPSTSAGRDIRILPLHETLVGDVRPALMVLQAAVGLVLLIACANVSSLLIARATGRRRELAIRAALGANRRRLIRQLLTESLVLGIAGGLTGLLVGAWLTVLLVRLLPDGVPRADGITLDRVVAFATLSVALATGVLFGVMPALQASRANASTALKQSGERTSAARTRGRAALVVAEIALTLVLLAGAGLLVNSFIRLQRVESGLRAENVTLIGLAIPQTRYPTGAAQTALYDRVLASLLARPEFQAVGVGFPGPLRGSNASGVFLIEGRTSMSRDDRPFTHFGSVSGGYFSAMGIPLVAGRIFDGRDIATGPGVVIVSAGLARKYWPGENALGKHLRFEDDPNSPWMTVVGIVGDVRQLGLQEAPPPLLYFPYQQFPLPFTNVAVRSGLADEPVATLLRSELARIDADLSSGKLSTLQNVLDRSVDEPRFRTFVLGAFALMALVLAAVGVYGLISYSVTQRTREIGIRIALGARPRQIVLPVLREGLVLAGVGTAIGLAGGVAAARVLGRFLFGVGATDPVTFASVALVLLGVAVLASYFPSRRVLRVNPIDALRRMTLVPFPCPLSLVPF
ncbi:MAG: ABC transporter permease [Acidobacteria bacterium]|nr:ABC transporter permease [Acidobacteriota bacterium]